MLAGDEIRDSAKQTVAVKIKQPINKLEAAGILIIIDDAYELGPDVKNYLTGQ